MAGNRGQHHRVEPPPGCRFRLQDSESGRPLRAGAAEPLDETRSQILAGFQLSMFKQQIGPGEVGGGGRPAIAARGDKRDARRSQPGYGFVCPLTMAGFTAIEPFARQPSFSSIIVSLIRVCFGTPSWKSDCSKRKVAR